MDPGRNVVTLVCRLLAADGEPLPERGVVRLRVEDVTYLDGAAPVVGEAEYDLAAHAPDHPDLGPLSVDAAFEEGRTYGLAVHLDVSGSGQVEPGDLVTTAFHDAREAAASELEVPLTRIPA